MNSAEDLFGESELSLEDVLRELELRLDDVVSRLRLPPRSLVVRDNNGKVVRSWSVCVNEPPYPLPAWEVGKKDYALSPLYNISEKGGSIVAKVQKSLLDCVPAPAGASVAGKEDDTGAKVVTAMNAESIDWLSALAEAGVKKYKSSAQSFGCCGHYVECSDRGECVHDNRLYSTVCAYRRNLEAGRVFYGRNANVK